MDPPWWVWLLVAAAVLGIADRLLLAAEAKRWINYRKTPANRGTASRAAASLQQFLEPDKAHIIEAQNEEADHIERESSGDPPTDATR